MATKNTNAGAKPAASTTAKAPVKSAAPTKAAAAKAAGAKATGAESAAAKTTGAKTAKVAAAKQAPAEVPDAGIDDAEVPMNRAERRAKGRGKSLAQLPGARGKVTGGHGPAHVQRNWANRRTG